MSQGVQPQSKPVKAGNWIIFAANAFTPDWVDEQLDYWHIPYKRLQGRYNGQDEHSWLVHAEDWAWSYVQLLATGEHAVLELRDRDPDACMCRMAYITTINTKNPVTTFTGWLQEVTKKAAKFSDAYSFDVEDHRYWIINEQAPVPVKPKVVRSGVLFYDFTAPHAAGIIKHVA